jgi:hypothetical protein
MKLLNLLLAMPFLFGSAIRAQDLSLVEPGDILVVKIVTADGKSISKVEAVTQEGTLQPPHLPGVTSSEKVTVGGLSVDTATNRLSQSYRQATVTKLKEIEGRSHVKITIERGTVSQLLDQ